MVVGKTGYVTVDLSKVTHDNEEPTALTAVTKDADIFAAFTCGVPVLIYDKYLEHSEYAVKDDDSNIDTVGVSYYKIASDSTYHIGISEQMHVFVYTEE